MNPSGSFPNRPSTHPLTLRRSEGRIVDGASQWFFDNLLPEEKTRDVLAREAKVDAPGPAM